MTPTPPASPVGLTGARFGRAVHSGGPVATSSDGGEQTTDGPGFATVVRGYERAQVDAFVRRQLAVAEKLRDDLARAEERHDRAQRRAVEVETENRSLRASAAGPAAPVEATGTVESGFGVRAEKLLRLAEAEAAEVRSQAARDGADLMERSRIDAERHRHEVEEALIARVAELDHLAARREAEIAEREEQAARRLDAARAESDRVNAVALRDADRIRRDAETTAEGIRTSLRAEADRLREEARREVDRLVGLRDEALGDIQRLAEVLVAEVAPSAGSPGVLSRSGPRGVAGTEVRRALPAGVPEDVAS